MKTIKYLSDGTIAKVGMRVKVNDWTGKIAYIRNDYPVCNGLKSDDGIIIRPDTPQDGDLYRMRGLYWIEPERCTPIK